MRLKFEKHLYKQVFPEKLPDIIYHYTTQKGILGIIQTKEMWATQVHFLNDKNEIYLTFSLLKQELQHQFNKAQCPDYKAMMHSILTFLDEMDQGHICISSFCERGDLLSQWRGYGNQGKGYAIGFDREKLTKIANQHNFVLWPCVYDPALQKELVSYLVDSWGQKFAYNKVTKEEMLTKIDVDVCQLAPILKDESFSEEKEWRLVSSVVADESPRFAFREGEFSLIPYYNFPVTDPETGHCIDKIVVGPSPHVELAYNSLRTFLNAQRLSRAEIEISKIPFRNWK